MNIYQGSGTTKYGPGVQIDLSVEDVAAAISAYLVAHDVNISGARTIRVNGDMIEQASVYVDPSGIVIYDGEEISGRGRTHSPKE